MKLTLTINLNDVAPEETLHDEVAKLLGQVVDLARECTIVTELDGKHMRDTYGNTVGRVTIR